MTTSDALPTMYEDLANHFARQGESRQRDQCLVLAADAALGAGRPEEAERLRKRLLLTNPHHMLRPYPSMADAMHSSDVRDFVADLRRQWPPENVAKLLNNPGHGEKPAKSISATAAAEPAPEEPEPVAGLGYILSILEFALGLGVAIVLLITSFGGPYLHLK